MLEQNEAFDDPIFPGQIYLLNLCKNSEISKKKFPIKHNLWFLICYENGETKLILKRDISVYRKIFLLRHMLSGLHKSKFSTNLHCRSASVNL